MEVELTWMYSQYFRNIAFCMIPFHCYDEFLNFLGKHGSFHDHSKKSQNFPPNFLEIRI